MNTEYECENAFCGNLWRKAPHPIFKSIFATFGLQLSSVKGSHYARFKASVHRKTLSAGHDAPILKILQRIL